MVEVLLLLSNIEVCNSLTLLVAIVEPLLSFALLKYLKQIQAVHCYSFLLCFCLQEWILHWLELLNTFAVLFNSSLLNGPAEQT